MGFRPRLIEVAAFAQQVTLAAERDTLKERSAASGVLRTGFEETE
jgi:hypothetical protein